MCIYLIISKNELLIQILTLCWPKHYSSKTGSTLLLVEEPFKPTQPSLESTFDRTNSRQYSIFLFQTLHLWSQCACYHRSQTTYNSFQKECGIQFSKAIMHVDKDIGL